MIVLRSIEQIYATPSRFAETLFDSFHRAMLDLMKVSVAQAAQYWAFCRRGSTYENKAASQK